MPRRILIERRELTYAGGLVLHTATSGAVPVLRELRLLAERDSGLEAVGASRTNIAYLSGIAAEVVEEAVLEVAAGLDWSAPWEALLPGIDARHPDLPAPARMLFEMAAADARARQAGLPLWRWLGGEGGAETPPTDTNQTLFWQDETAMLARAGEYAARGFLQLKLRIGIAGFEEDLARFRRLRERLGPAARLSVDANGCWDASSAPEHLRALAALGAEYVEQPLPASDWAAAADLARGSPVPLMLDESLSSPAAIARMAREGTAQLAHLKLAKLGGLDRMMTAGRLLGAAGIGVMVGQMNEGVVSTLAAAHAAIALGAPLRELYGSDGLRQDPALPAPSYGDGLLHLPQGPGLGIAHHKAGPDILWETTAP
ncbi:mandelate racemase/muconate lactonizing enzyme family protein [Pararoseomonas indoligenes]|uniref:Mandelate racemase/muconate lactonizing enzyme C-terminal domain-containing protein n=1 Tax=Roseomonas indoligenes TaxID=2820811 RepID=A0A940N448_9PROT|nr:mandelate racemase/muconate lactonizing enzyme family protein [Pararoseomonas indoligenes]MBP0496337.1 hypothetical protein [Pararoseomonas indoligenes]